MEYTVIVPVFNEAKSVGELADRIAGVFRSLHKENQFEILFVDDGSRDGTRETLKALAKERRYLRIISLRKNFGKSFALTAGFMNAQGDFILTIDGDLQDRPEEIPQFIAKIREGYDLVCGKRVNRKDGAVRAAGSRLFNYFASLLAGIRLYDVNCGFKMYRKTVVANISVYGQYHRLIPILSHFLGFKVCEIPVTHDKRRYGPSKYPPLRYQGFFDLLSLIFLHKYRFSPLYFFGLIGLALMIPSLLIIGIFCTRILLWFCALLPKPDISFNRPILAMSTAGLIMGLHIFLTGFVCDFILHHQNRKNLTESLERMIDESA